MFRGDFDSVAGEGRSRSPILQCQGIEFRFLADEHGVACAVDGRGEGFAGIIVRFELLRCQYVSPADRGLPRRRFRPGGLGARLWRIGFFGGRVL